jgi:hypothetical protein
MTDVRIIVWFTWFVASSAWKNFVMRLSTRANALNASAASHGL